MGAGDSGLDEPLTEREMDVLRRLAQGASDREIATALFLAVSTVKWYNKQIYGKLGAHSRTQAVARARDLGLLDGPSRGDRPTPRPPHNLPAPVTSFVGRRREIADVEHLLTTTRLLTLTGPPGTGKTRLALQVAAEIRDRFPDGVTFIDMAPVGDPHRVPGAIAQALGVHETGTQPVADTLKRALRGKHLLLVLDNFEHVVAAAPLVGELLAAAPGLRVLVTSREPLSIYGEQEYTVPPLALPHRTQPVQALPAVEAVDLFIQRARAVEPHFALTEENAAAVAETCIRLDGLPLAIELAAAQIRMWTPEALVARLEHRFSVLSSGARDVPPRQRTLHATLDWSYDLLSREAQTLLARLGVFAGGWTADLATAVCREAPETGGLKVDVWQGLAALLTRSLIMRAEDLAGEPRFSMLETIRAYARERLEASGEAEIMRRRHALAFVALAEEAAAELRGGPRQAHWFARLRAEQANLRAALGWALGGADVALGVRLAAAVSDFWYDEGLIGEGWRWTEQALAHAATAPRDQRAQLANAAGELAFAQGNYARGRELNGEALALYRALGDRANTAWALVMVGVHALAFPEQIREGIALCEEGLALFRQLDHRAGTARALVMLGELSRVAGDDRRAQRVYEEARALYRQIGDRRREGMVLHNIGHLAYRAGDYARARALMVEGVTLMSNVGSDYFVAFGLAGLAGPLAALGTPARAARLLGASAAILESMGVGLQPADQPAVAQYEALAREQLDPAAFEAAWAEGAAMSLAEAVAYALES